MNKLELIEKKIGELKVGVKFGFVNGELIWLGKFKFVIYLSNFSGGVVKTLTYVIPARAITIVDESMNLGSEIEDESKCLYHVVIICLLVDPKSEQYPEKDETAQPSTSGANTYRKRLSSDDSSSSEDSYRHWGD